MGVLDIIDTNRLELRTPGVQLAVKEVRYHDLVCLSSYHHFLRLQSLHSISGGKLNKLEKTL